uniref:V-type proton ATPase subunit G n=1 Tax=Strombidium rassoulzadegani TaxID=1082188 RepID=A0A7S3CMW3_9SPIT|mmetsp:Transcript_17745/g.30051  ORF Transcript_17745/g.30051 Transcript_17745/m.30051 type:complete len:122 (+) Transcript_17745:54-419(+)
MNQSTASLLQGERLAHEIVQAAEDEKQKMQNNAQFEAKQELAQIKQDLNEQFEQLKKQRERQTDDLEVYEQQADAEVELIRASFEENKERTIELLLDRIMNVKIDIPRVVVGNFEKQLESQ